MRARSAWILCLAASLFGGCASDEVWLHVDVDFGSLSQEVLDRVQSMKVDLIAVPVEIGTKSVDAGAVCEGLGSGAMRPDQGDLTVATLTGGDDEYASEFPCVKPDERPDGGATAVWAQNPDRIRVGPPLVDGGQDVDVVVYCRAFDGDACDEGVVARGCKGFPLFPDRDNVLTLELAALEED